MNHVIHLLELSSFENETNMNASNHYEFKFVLGVFKPYSNVISIIVENSAVNVSFVGKVGCTLLVDRHTDSTCQ